MTFRLKFVNDWDDRWTEERGNVFWFCNLGNTWPGDSTRRLIERTTRDKAQAREFESSEEAKDTLFKAGNPRGWSVVDEEGKIVE